MGAPSTLEPGELGVRVGQVEPPEGPLPRRRRWLWLVIVVLVASGLYFLWPRSTGQKATTANSLAAGARGLAGPVPVVAVKAQRGNIGVYVTALGTVTPLYTVTVKSRVDGQLMRVLYKEGDVVHQGDLLAEIDPRPFQVQLAQAEGQLLKDQAALDNARIDIARYKTLVVHNAVPEQQVATQEALVKQDEGAVKADQANIENAKLQLVYCHITAPITGRVGLRLVDPGNIVHASDTNGLLVITQVQPISVIFTVAEDQLPEVLEKVRQGERLRVDAYDRELKTRLASGVLTAVDNQIDQTTGTLKLRALFDNKDNALFPNQFVNTCLLVEEKRGVTLIPTATIQRNSQMTYVYLVKPDSTVTVRPITVGTTEGEQSEVTSGLEPGDTVVLTGVDRLQEGTKVAAQVESSNPRGSTGRPGAGQARGR
jgi:multidrug efflux system membrane fusion protein